MRTIKGSMKAALRRHLAQTPDERRTFERHDGNVFMLGWEGQAPFVTITLPEYDEEGDPIAEAYVEEIATAVETLVNEHNASLPAPPEENKGVMNKIKSWFGG